ncbi:hypothetical protein COO60DRAFT_2636 [Scenedesmus sp. NREL 46B-D3]|nr:hypothetical protein COO60DRAFT_2636 [Scenedesmus sp. NREL 46B-D3]
MAVHDYAGVKLLYCCVALTRVSCCTLKAQLANPAAASVKPFGSLNLCFWPPIGASQYACGAARMILPLWR